MEAKEIIKKYILDTISTAESIGDALYFSTFKYKDDDNIWFQLQSDCFNASYPFDERPEDKLQELFLQYNPSDIIDWQEQSFFTISFEKANIEQISEFIASYFYMVYKITIESDTFVQEEDSPNDTKESILQKMFKKFGL